MQSLNQSISPPLSLMDGRKEGWMDGWMDGYSLTENQSIPPLSLMDGWIDERMGE